MKASEMTLTEDDIQRMNPSDVANMWAKAREEIKSAVDNVGRVREQIEQQRGKLRHMEKVATYFQQQVQERDAALSLVAQQLISQGVLGAVRQDAHRNDGEAADAP